MSSLPSIRTPYIWKNGTIISRDAALDHNLNHALHYGGSVFEGIRFYATAHGTKVFRLKEHIQRLLYSAKILGLHVPYTEEILIQAVLELVARSGESGGYIRPIVYSKPFMMTPKMPDGDAEVTISVRKFGKYLSNDPIAVKIPQTRRVHPQTTHIEAKIGGVYTNSTQALLEIKDTPYKEILFLDTQGYIAEGSGENIFFTKGTQVYTTPRGTILPGITRDTVITLVQDEMHLVVQEKHISPEELGNFDGAFFTGTAAEITPIGTITTQDEVVYTYTYTEESITTKVKKLYGDVVTGEHAKYIQRLW